MQVTHYGTARFLVTSESSPNREPYLTDLLEYRRHGQCDCDHFRIRIQPDWEAGKMPARTACKHLLRVRRFLARKIRQACEHPLNRRMTLDDLQPAVDRLLFKIARIEVNARTTPECHGKKSFVSEPSELPESERSQADETYSQ